MLGKVGFNPVELFNRAEANTTAESTFSLAPGTYLPKPLDTVSLGLALVLGTAGLPDPDFLVRTSGELRLSNFLLWQLAYAEIYVTDVLWPDFRRPELEKAFASFRARERRFGQTSAQVKR